MNCTQVRLHESLSVRFSQFFVVNEITRDDRIIFHVGIAASVLCKRGLRQSTKRPNAIQYIYNHFLVVTVFKRRVNLSKLFIQIIYGKLYLLSKCVSNRAILSLCTLHFYEFIAFKEKHYMLQSSSSFINFQLIKGYIVMFENKQVVVLVGVWNYV